MSWDTLQTIAQQMGFEVAFRTRCGIDGGFMPDLTPPTGQNWIFVGRYDDVAAFWVKPLNINEHKLNSTQVRKMMAELDPFIGNCSDSDLDFFEEIEFVQPPLPMFGRVERRRLPGRDRRCTPSIAPLERRALAASDRRNQLATVWLS